MLMTVEVTSILSLHATASSLDTGYTCRKASVCDRSVHVSTVMKVGEAVQLKFKDHLLY